MNRAAVEEMLGELLRIMAQKIPEIEAPESAQATFARGRNAEKEAVDYHLRFHMQRLGLRLPGEPGSQPGQAAAAPMDWDKYDAAHGR